METRHAEALLALEGVTISVNRARSTPLTLVSDVTLAVRRGECLAIVGESGSGKSITAMSIAGLLPSNMTISGSVRLDGDELTTMSSPERRRLGGSEIGFIFQDAMTALHPLMSIREQMIRPIRQHLRCSRKEAESRARDLLDRVGIPVDREILNSYVHQLSGGMRQRVMIAMALSCGPSLVVADEPTTALDAGVQGQILELLQVLRHDEDLAMILISHDISVVARYSDRLAVMYAGQIVEMGQTHGLLQAPTHPYTDALVRASPEHGVVPDRLPTIPGQIPQLDLLPPGCRFEPRCPVAIAQSALPQLMVQISDDRQVRCCNPRNLSGVS